MLVKVLVCASTEFGCVFLVPGDPRESRAAVSRGCGRNGWEVGSARHLPKVGESIYYVTGPTPQEFRAALAADPDFDFSGCA